MGGPLTGIRILDLSWIVAGPLASRLLADFGAEVIKVESQHRMDIGRANRTPLYGVLPGDANSNPDTGGYFQDVNAGKVSCTLNLALAEGRALLQRLVAITDVIVCNLGGDQLRRWGVDYARARRINPQIIVVNMPTMESEGPRARWRAFGDMIAAAAGMKSVSGHAGDGPLPFGHQYPDFSANPFHAAVAVMAALHHRERTGEGQLIEVSQYESTIAMLGTAVLEHSASGRTPRQQGNADPDAAPHNIYRCRGEDSWCAISILNDAQWQALAAIDGLEALRRPEYGTLAGRREHEGAIDAAIEAWTMGQDRQEVADLLQARGVPAGPYQMIREMVEVDPVLSGAHFIRYQHPVGREFMIHGNPLRMTRHPAHVRGAPLLGEHTFQVLHDTLGLSVDEIADAAAGGAIE